MNPVRYPNSPWWLKTKIFTFGVAFHFFVAGNRRHFKLNMCVEHSKSQLTITYDKTSLKWAFVLCRLYLIDSLRIKLIAGIAGVTMHNFFTILPVSFYSHGTLIFLIHKLNLVLR